VKLKWMRPNVRCEAKIEDKPNSPWKIATICHVIRRTEDASWMGEARMASPGDDGKKGDIIAVIVQFDDDLELISKKPRLVRKPGAIDRLAAIVRPPPGRQYGKISGGGTR